MSEEGPDEPEQWETVGGEDADRPTQGADADDETAPPRSGGGSASGDAGDLDERQRQLNKRERELEQREQEVLERREETVQRQEDLDEREAELDRREQTMEERARDLDQRTTELDQREADLDTREETIDEYLQEGGADAFTYKPRVTAAFLLWAVAVAGAVLTVGTFLYASDPNPPLLSAQLLSDTGRLAATGLLGVATLVELVGGFTTYYGRSWYFSVFAAIVGIVVLLPVGLTATVMITVGEAGFD